MDLQPIDLGSRRLIEILRRRAAASSGMENRTSASGTTPATHVGFLGRMWLKGTDLDESTAREVLGVIRPFTGGMGFGFGLGFGLGFGCPAVATWATHGPIAISVVFSLLSLTGATVGLTAPGTMARRWLTSPLSIPELDLLVSASTDDLERSYLALVRDILQHQGLSGEAAKELREAVRALGDALDRLPSNPPSVLGRDTAALRQEIEDLRQQALAESDPIVSESLERRAEAMERSAAALEQSSLVLRRGDALRQELIAQTEALRLGLSANHGATAADASHLAHLASAARGVAREASSLSLARAEVDGISGRYPAQPVAEAPVQRIGNQP